MDVLRDELLRVHLRKVLLQHLRAEQVYHVHEEEEEVEPHRREDVAIRVNDFIDLAVLILVLRTTEALIGERLPRVRAEHEEDGFDHLDPDINIH
jgi:hypothetical protein